LNVRFAPTPDVPITTRMTQTGPFVCLTLVAVRSVFRSAEQV
jgi:hypothetical protein